MQDPPNYIHGKFQLIFDIILLGMTLQDFVYIYLSTSLLGSYT